MSNLSHNAAAFNVAVNNVLKNNGDIGVIMPYAAGIYSSVALAFPKDTDLELAGDKNKYLPLIFKCKDPLKYYLVNCQDQVRKILDKLNENIAFNLDIAENVAKAFWMIKYNINFELLENIMSEDNKKYNYLPEDYSYPEDYFYSILNLKKYLSKKDIETINKFNKEIKEVTRKIHEFHYHELF